MPRIVHLAYAAILGAVILPFVVVRDAIAYKRQWSGTFQAAKRYTAGLVLIWREHKVVAYNGFRWSPLRYYVLRESGSSGRIYKRVLQGGVSFWDYCGRGPGYIGGFDFTFSSRRRR